MMRHLDSKYIGVAQGDDVLFSDYEDGGDMWTGSGSRERRHSLKFPETFKSPPAVHVSLSMWDMDSATNARADVTAEKVTERGFDVVFRTWADTRVARARIRWMAIGEVFHEDDWQDVYKSVSLNRCARSTGKVRAQAVSKRLGSSALQGACGRGLATALSKPVRTGLARR